MKGKAPRKNILHGIIADLVLLKLFISGKERCNTTESATQGSYKLEKIIDIFWKSHGSLNLRKNIMETS